MEYDIRYYKSGIPITKDDFLKMVYDESADRVLCNGGSGIPYGSLTEYFALSKDGTINEDDPLLVSCLRVSGFALEDTLITQIDYRESDVDPMLSRTKGQVYGLCRSKP